MDITLSGAQIERLVQVEQGLDLLHPERSSTPVRVLGYGEISTVLAVEAEGLEGLAFKRLPLFHSTDEVERYQEVLDEYLRLLVEEIGLCLPQHGRAGLVRASGKPVFYIVQSQLPAQAIGHRVLHHLPAEGVCDLVRRVLGELHKLWEYNRRQGRVQVGIDGQLSNWCLRQFDPRSPRAAGGELCYLDTSTPLFRVEGVEQLNTELFLRSAPSFLAWILRLFFLKDVVDRYYDFHRVAVDLAANLYKEQRPELIPTVVGCINDYFGGEAAGLSLQPVTEKEVRSYYREDATIWRLYLSMRKVDRTLHRRVLHREYPYMLPDKVKR